jgi:hypothetical protein
MNLMAKIEQTKKLWATMLPHVPAPDPAWIGRWCESGERTIEHAIVRTSKKFSPEKISAGFKPEAAWRYTSGVVMNEGRQVNRRNMDSTELRTLWGKAFGQTPDDELFPLMAQYASRSENNEKTLLWLLMKSSTQLFPNESERALWIARQVAKAEEGIALPGFNDPMEAA